MREQLSSDVLLLHRYLENRGSNKRHTVTGALLTNEAAAIEDLQERFSSMPIKSRRGIIVIHLCHNSVTLMPHVLMTVILSSQL